MTNMINIKFSSLPNLSDSYKLLESISEKKKRFIFKPRKVDKKLMLYGAGNQGKMAKQCFDILNIPVSYVIDRNPELYKNDKFWKKTNTIIHKPNEIPVEEQKSSLLAMCIIKLPFTDLVSQLKEYKWNDIVPFYDIIQAYNEYYPLNNGWYIKKLTDKDITNIRNILSKLEDDKSRAYYLQFIAWHVLREEWIFKDAPIVNSEKYFISEIVSILHNNEVFIDIGAYEGEYTLEFLKNVDNKFNAIYAFETDIENFRVLCNNCNDLKEKFDEKIYLSNKAFGIKSEKRKFYYGLNSISQLSRLGNSIINVTKLDDIRFSNKPTLIKIHVEGTEVDILKGGIKIIKNNRPILLVAIYHNKKGLWKNIYEIMNLLNDYIFYFRLHAWNGTSGIVYAIPKERLK